LTRRIAERREGPSHGVQALIAGDRLVLLEHLEGAALHGSIDNPLDHRGVYPPLCSVLFSVRELFGGASLDTLSVDVHEDWLTPAEAAGQGDAEER
jgi:hypothetical protein